MAVGLASLLVGAAVVWLTLSRQDDLERLGHALATRSTEARQQPAAASGSADVLLNGLRQRVAELEANVPSGEERATNRQTDALHSRLAEIEAQIAVLKSAPATVEHALPTVSAVKQAIGVGPTPAPAALAASDPTPASAVTVVPPEPSPAPASASEPVLVPTPVAIAEVAPVVAVGSPVVTDAPNPVPVAPKSVPPSAAAPAPAPLPKPLAADARKEPPAATKPAAKPVAAAPKPPSMATGGSWAVVVQSFGSETEAQQRLVQVAALGLPAEIRQANVKGKLWYRVLVAGYPTQDAARKAATDLGRQNLGAPWVLSLGMP